MLPTTSPACPEKLTGLPLSQARLSGTECLGWHRSTVARFANATDKRREAAVDMNNQPKLPPIHWDLGRAAQELNSQEVHKSFWEGVTRISMGVKIHVLESSSCSSSSTNMVKGTKQSQVKNRCLRR